MEFDKSKVYTALNADELKVGSKVICAFSISDLKKRVDKGEQITEVHQILNEDVEQRFKVYHGDDEYLSYPFAYLISEPEEENWIVYLCRKNSSNPEDYYLTACRSDRWESVKEEYYAKFKLFEGTEDEAEEWYTNRRYLADIITAWEDGKTIQLLDDSTDKWNDILNPKWSTDSRYRIKPEGLKWTDLKVGDIVRRINTDISGVDVEAMVVAIDKDSATDFHVMIGSDWTTDNYLANAWGKVEC